jgi:hypothetical protein
VAERYVNISSSTREHKLQGPKVVRLSFPAVAKQQRLFLSIFVHHSLSLFVSSFLFPFISVAVEIGARVSNPRCVATQCRARSAFEFAFACARVVPRMTVRMATSTFTLEFGRSAFVR